MRLLIFGAPGVGKGTQATRLAGRYGLAHVSTGDTLRQAVRQGLPLAEHVRQYLEQGLLAPDALVTEIIERRLIQPDCRRGFILDGFPRTISQARMLDAMLKKRRLLLDAAIFLAADDEVLVRRMSGRRVCPLCGRSYHADFAPPERVGVCDDDGQALQQRADDTPEGVRKRLLVYQEATAPLREYFLDGSVLIEVDGSGSADEVESAIVKLLDRLSPAAEAARVMA